MANNFFRFKQFTVFQDKCGMKVGTDGVLLGAWCQVADRKRVLDIGTGTGLIALMIAQRNETAQIDALEIDSEAHLQAQINFEASPWKERLNPLLGSFVDYKVEPEHRYDLIVSNPPYFENSLKANCDKRSQARHTDTLPFDELIAGAAQLLTEKGLLSLVYPVEANEKIQQLALTNGLICVRQVLVKGNPLAAVKRVLAEFTFAAEDVDKSIVSSAPETSELIVEMERHQYSDTYIALTRAFYLKMN